MNSAYPKADKWTSLIMVAGMTCLCLSGCKSIEIVSGWPTGPMQIDGDPSDWSGLNSFRLFQDQGVVVGASNDSKQLRILFRFKDMHWARGILRSGLTLWLDTEGKAKKRFGLRYTGGPDPSELPARRGRGSFGNVMTPQMEERRRQRREKLAGRIEILIDGPDSVVIVPQDGSRGPAAAFAQAGGSFTYEFGLPLLSQATTDLGIMAEPGKIISLGCQWGGLSDEERREMRENFVERGGGGTGGARGGGRGGGGPSGGSGPGGRPAFQDSQELWIRLTLATPPEPSQP